MLDAKGNVYVWFASGSSAALINITGTGAQAIGKTVVISGTVKDHKDYKGTKETILTRVKLEA